MLDTQDTQPLPILSQDDPLGETRQARYHRLKAFSDQTGVRLIFVYLADERRRRKAAKGSCLPSSPTQRPLSTTRSHPR